MRYLLDTNAVSEPQRPRPDPGYMAWIGEREAEDLAISALAYGELARGVAVLPAGKRRSELSAWLAEGLTFFGERILPVDVKVATVWADVWAANRRAGRVVGVVDELTAATALAHGLTVVTRNLDHFDESGCELLSPWSV